MESESLLPQPQVPPPVTGQVAALSQINPAHAPLHQLPEDPF